MSTILRIPCLLAELMATRNLTNKFVELRNQYKSRRERNVGRSYGYEAHGGAPLMSEAPTSADFEVGVGVPLSQAPEWVEIVQQIRADIDLTKRKLGELQKLHTERLKVSFGVVGVEVQKERDIDILTQHITGILKKSENSLKRIAVVGNAPGTRLPKEEQMVRLNVMRNFASSLRGLSKDFRNSQKDYLHRLRGQENFSAEFFQSDSQGSMSLDEAIDRGLTAGQVQHLAQIEKKATDREKEILHIATSINDLAQIFKELNVLVVEQGTILDRIDYNVEQTLIKVKDGVVHIRKADDYSKKNRTMKCVGLLLLLIAILIIVIIEQHKSPRSSNGSKG
eukprot:gb/GEZN01008158.1/.p1 GENE.gb/GEZN01008158.1/~~gb/GEZN01008158.1/.p1  ORF type:complete len:338 (-),score=56.99 gb/GEZN01008158.1/:365-1378(-)